MIPDATPAHIEPDAFRSYTIDGAIEEATAFHMDGLDRRWNWCLDADGKYRCSATIAPNGDGLYFKFLRGESTAKPSRFYACRRVRS